MSSDTSSTVEVLPEFWRGLPEFRRTDTSGVPDRSDKMRYDIIYIMRTSIWANRPDPVKALSLLLLALAAAICRSAHDLVSKAHALRLPCFHELFFRERVGFIAFAAIPQVAMLARRRLPRTHSRLPLATDQGWMAGLASQDAKRPKAPAHDSSQTGSGQGRDRRDRSSCRKRRARRPYSRRTSCSRDCGHSLGGETLQAGCLSKAQVYIPTLVA